MRDFTYSLKEYINKGLAHKNNKRNQPFLTECIGAVPYEGALRAIEAFTRIDTSSMSGVLFPYPQLFILSRFIILCTRNTIYEYDSVSGLISKLSGLTPGTTWDIVDFRTYIYLTNGQQAVTRDSLTGVYAIDTTVPFGACVCNYNGQILLGGPSGEAGDPYFYTKDPFTAPVTLYIGYADNTNNVLKLAQTVDSGNTWSTSNIANGNQFISIVTDSNSYTHISYYDANASALKYITNLTGSWIISTPATDSGVDTSIAVDSSDKVYISYRDGSNNLKYATNASGVWVDSIIDDTVLDTGYNTSIAIDSLDKLHISYQDGDNSDLRYATNASGVWVLTTLDNTAVYTGYYTSIAIDSSDKVHISYIYLSNMDLMYATNASGAWVLTTLDSVDTINNQTSIAIDSSDKVHISYYDQTNGALKYATNVSGAWVYSTLDSVDDVGYYSSLSIDDTGAIHISYQDITNYDLKYVTNFSGQWVVSTIDSTGSVGGFSSITVVN